MPTRTSGNRRTVYRLALYGVRASGKTSILAALSMPRAANPGRYTCCWVEEDAGNPHPPGDPSDWVTSDPFHRGYRWLSAQRERLRRGEPPETNSPRDGLMSYLFDFTAPGRGAFRVEMVDYSGELIALTSGELAARIRQHMKDCDGLLLLAEAPHSERDTAPLTKDFEILKAAFNVLLGERDASARQDWPMAILLNKWDRRGPIAFEDPEAETSKLGEFLGGSSTLPHRGLVDVVENVVTDKNLLVRPVSAFGAHEIGADGVERPRFDGGQLRSFGLEDPFVWLALRRDEIDLRQFEAAVSGCSHWKFWHLFTGRNPAVSAHAANTSFASQLRGDSIGRCLLTGLRLRERLTAGSPAERRLNTQLRTAWRRLGGQVAMGLIVLIALLLGVEAVLDGVHHRQILADEANPALPLSRLQADEAWLEGYFASPAYRHVVAKRTFLEPSLASRTLEHLRSRTDEAAWAPVAKYADERTKAKQAKQHLDDFPQCPHSSQATEWVQRGAELENLEHLQKLEAERKALNGSDAKAETVVQDILRRIDSPPHPSADSEEYYTQKVALREELLRHLKEIQIAQGEAKWRAFHAKVLDLLGKKQVGKAAIELASRDPDDPHVKELVGTFASQCVPIVTDQVEQHLKSRSWTAARDAWKSANNDVAVKKLLSLAQTQALESLVRKIDEAQDREMYKQVQINFGNREFYVNQYLDSVPLGRMRKAVTAYKDYLGRINGPLDLKLVLQQIDWGDCWDNEKHEVRVTVDGKPLIEATVKASRYTRTGQVGPAAEIHKVLTEEIRVQVHVIQKNWLIIGGSDHDAGTGGYAGTVIGLNGRTLELNAPDHTNRATFVVTGFPKEPGLPEWGQDR